FAHTPDARADQCGVLGKGAMLGFSPVLDRALTKRLEALAKAHDIPLQYEVMGGRTGTDADMLTVAAGGVRTALLSIPERYMHTPVEVVSTADVEAVAALMAALAEEGAVA
ncbi:MAG: M42 family peptidase, partial [Clostridia bacterium]|nr:M42 family peptidase [Clostridia bacterium]